jgi:hypothetical protein
MCPMYTDNEGISMLLFIIDNILVEFKLSEPLAMFSFTHMRQSLYKNIKTQNNYKSWNL